MFGAGDLLKRFKPLCQAMGKWNWFVMLKLPFGEKVPRGSAKVIWGTISVCFMNISETDINAALITCSVQTKSGETATEEGGMDNGIWEKKW